MTTLYLMQGLPASGKTTFAKELIKEGKTVSKNTVIISSDDVRAECIPEGMYHESEIPDTAYQSLVNTAIWNAIDERVTEALKIHDVILDATFIRRDWWLPFIKKEIHMVGITLRPHLNKCIKRDALRERSVGEEIITQMYNEFQSMEVFSDFDSIIIRKL